MFTLDMLLYLLNKIIASAFYCLSRSSNSVMNAQRHISMMIITIWFYLDQRSLNIGASYCERVLLTTDEIALGD